MAERHIWGYWDCPYCGTKAIRGDNKKCPYCGMQIPPDTRYYIREDIQEEVEQDKLDNDAQWICEYCDTYNLAFTDHCFNCGAPRADAQRDYFGNGLNGHPSRRPVPQNPPSGNSRSTADSLKAFVKQFRKSLIFGAIIIFVMWLFMPITRTATVSRFEWERTVAIEEYRNVDESDWFLPQKANLHETKEEIKSYKQVLDHYETKTKQVAHEVQDGYDTDYEDLGNGQFREVRTPRYRTEYRTETYEEPVYRNEPVYATKYYYDIDKWVKADESRSSGYDQEPYWNEPDLPETVSAPKYGDRRKGMRTGQYYAVITSKKGGEYRKELTFEQWQALSEGDTIKYKTSRFSDKPLSDL